MLVAWKQVGVLTDCGYILGVPNDTPASIKRDIEIIQRELPGDRLEFFYLTPLPGSGDHKKLHDAAGAIDPDMNRQDLNPATSGHPRSAPVAWGPACWWAGGR